MLARMTCESFETGGTLIESSVGVGLAWVCHKDSFADCLPIWNETRDVCLVFFGEEFCDPPEIAALAAKRHRFSAGNAAYLVHLYEEHGVDFLDRLNGTFSGVLVDLRNKRVVLFNDRYGLGRIYYHESPDGFYFASEAKALLKVLPDLWQLDLQGLGEWFSCGCVLQNRSLFSGISILPGGSAWTFSCDGKREKRCYFKPNTWESQPPLGAEEYYEHLRDTFPRVLKRYLRASQPIGMSLTGGLDGRMIMAWADSKPGDLPCYTFNGPYHDCLDLRIGRRVAAACGQPHHVIQIDDRFLKEFPSLAEKAILVSDGEMDVTGAVELNVNRLAREIAPIRLTGNYGSEIIRGNVAFGPGRLTSDLFSPELAGSIDQATTTYLAERKCSRLAFIAFKQVPWHHHARLSVEQSQVTLRSPFLDNDIVSLVFRAPESLRVAAEPSLRFIAAGRPGLFRIPTDRGVVYPLVPGLTILRRQFEEFMLRVEYAFDYGMPQRFAAVSGPLLPRWAERLFLGRQKFYHFRTWYHRELAPYVREILLDPRTLARPWYRGRAIELMVQGHTSGRRNYTREIHKVLSLELLQRQLLDQ
jgi:asparagine synthase (glutamine-hydrolysing)